MSWKNKYLRKVVSLFYSRFNYFLYLYSNNLPIVKNGFYYVIIKTFMYIFMITLYINAIINFTVKETFPSKKTKKLISMINSIISSNKSFKKKNKCYSIWRSSG